MTSPTADSGDALYYYAQPDDRVRLTTPGIATLGALIGYPPLTITPAASPVPAPASLLRARR